MDISDALHIGCNVSLRLVNDPINSYKHLAPYSDFKPWKSVWWIKEEGGWCHIWLASPKRANSSFLNLTRMFNMSVCSFGRDNPSLFFKNSFPEIQRIHDRRSLLHLTFSPLVSGRARKNGEATILSWMWVHLVTLARRMYFFSSDYSMIFW